MQKACGKCGRIHPYGYICKAGKNNAGQNSSDREERRLRSTYAWTQKAKQIKEKAQYLCEVCRDKGIYTYDHLEAHHIIKVREDKEKYLDDDNLVCLCESCHQQADAGELSKEYLQMLAGRRDAR